jgi:hypothetical protein
MLQLYKNKSIIDLRDEENRFSVYKCLVLITVLLYSFRALNKMLRIKKKCFFTEKKRSSCSEVLHRLRVSVYQVLRKIAGC